MSKADQADIYSIIENSASLTYSLQVQPTRLLELNNDHGAVDGYQDMFIDYYNTYTPGTIICKMSLISARQKTSDSIRSLSQDKLIQLTNEKKNGWLYSTKDKPSTKLYLVVVAGDATDGNSFTGWMGNQWRFSWSDNDYPPGTSDPYRRFVLKRNNKNYKGGTNKTRFYVDSTEFVKS